MHFSVKIFSLKFPNYCSYVFVASIIGLCFDILLFLFRLLLSAALKYRLIWFLIFTQVELQHLLIFSQYMSWRGSLWYPFSKKMPMKSIISLKPNVNFGLLHFHGNIWVSWTINFLLLLLKNFKKIYPGKSEHNNEWSSFNSFVLFLEETFWCSYISSMTSSLKERFSSSLSYFFHYLWNGHVNVKQWVCHFIQQSFQQILIWHKHHEEEFTQHFSHQQSFKGGFTNIFFVCEYLILF